MDRLTRNRCTLCRTISSALRESYPGFDGGAEGICGAGQNATDFDVVSAVPSRSYVPEMTTSDGTRLGTASPLFRPSQAVLLSLSLIVRDVDQLVPKSGVVGL